MNTMKKVCLIVLVLCASPVMAAVTIDFEDAPGGYFTSWTKDDVTFTAAGGASMWASTNPNGTLGLVGGDDPYYELRADIACGATSVAVDLGDYDADQDLLFLEIYDSSDTLLGYTDLMIPGEFVGMETLSLSASNIAYAIFGARQAVSGSSVYADNFTFAPVPAPGAVLLGGIGVGLVGWLRKRQTL